MAESTETSSTPAPNARQASRTAAAAAERGVETTTQAARDAGGAAADAAEKTVEGERRSFNDGAQRAGEVATTGLNAAKDMARQGAETTRRLAQDSRRAGVEMASVWRDAWDPMFKAQMESTRWFDQTWRQLTGFGAFPGLQTARPFAASPAPFFGAPPADVRETDEAYEVALETPGVARENLEVKLDGDLLTISGQKAEQTEQANSNYRVSERRFGRFSRSFPIPPDVRRDGIEASHKDGVLTVKLPKEADARPEAPRIEIR